MVRCVTHRVDVLSTALTFRILLGDLVPVLGWLVYGRTVQGEAILDGLRAQNYLHTCSTLGIV